ncbi:MAG: hypothetical protein RBG13Loki_1332 [Promethearchaeota archaeon CR_4]|nr:MAG: hypothetical protein RBG13Loki_1332 [Candidatus Lokiarchaeota archaeon CR_4]
MNTTAHASYSFFIYVLILQVGWHVWPNSMMCFLSLLAGIAPDLDAAYHTIVKKGNINDPTFQHHLHYWTHWPSSYLPVVIAFAFSLIFDFYPQYFLIAVVGPVSHLFFDSISCGDGMMWTAAWWKVKRGEFSKFTNFDAKKTDGYHGLYWSARYRQTKYFILENIAAGCVILFLVYLSLNGGLDVWHILSFISIGGVIFLGIKGVDAKYLQEPPQGRYADYHTYAPYVDWYQKKYGSSPPKKYKGG